MTTIPRVTLDRRMQPGIRNHLAQELERRFGSEIELASLPSKPVLGLGLIDSETISAVSAAISAAVAVVALAHQIYSRSGSAPSKVDLLDATAKELNKRGIHAAGTIVRIDNFAIAGTRDSEPCTITFEGSDGSSVLVFVHWDGTTSSHVIGLSHPLAHPAGGGL